MKEIKEHDLVTCDFCNELLNPEDVIFIKGEKSVICEYCILDANDVIDDFIDSLEFEDVILNDDDVLLRPSQIHEHLNDYVIGQEHAKQVLSVAVYNHYKCLDYKCSPEQEVELEKSNIVLIGPTGSGKTHLIQSLARILEVPYAIADATTLTEAGYVGSDVEEVLGKLISNADGDIELAEQGIIYIDEIDKLVRGGQNPSTTKDVGGEGVQQALLKMIEGSEVEVQLTGGRRHPMQETTTIDTSNILFIVGGSFSGIEKIIAKRNTKKSGMGFGSEVKSKKEIKFNDEILDITADDLRTFGIIPELIGRLPIICPLTELTEKELSQILTEPKNSLIKQYIQLSELDNVELEFEDDAIQAIAKKSLKNGTGARGLRSIIENIMLPYMYSMPDDEHLEKITITQKAVDGEEKPYMVYKQNQKQAD